MTVYIVFNKYQRKLKGQSIIDYRRNMNMMFRQLFLVKWNVIVYFCNILLCARTFVSRIMSV